MRPIDQRVTDGGLADVVGTQQHTETTREGAHKVLSRPGAEAPHGEVS